MRRAVFLDRDGVINCDSGYVCRWEDFVWVDGVLPAAARLVRAGYALIVVTNQSGIGRGYYSQTDFDALTARMCAAFSQAHAPIDAVYFCPHHPTDALGEYRCTCTCRKPAPGMIERAAREHNLDVAHSIMIGDSRRDMQAALHAGVPTRILVGKNGLSTPQAVSESTAVARDLAEAVEMLLADL